MQWGHKVHTVVPVLSTDLEVLPRFTLGRVFTDWGIDPIPFVVTVWAVGLYVLGVVVLRRRGDRWPVGRTLAFVGLGMGSFFFATSSGLGRYDTTLLSVHMVQHMLLSMVVPLALALGAPVTLALRTLPPAPRRWLLAVLHSPGGEGARVPAARLRPLRRLAVGALLQRPGTTPASRSAFVHQMMHVHLVLVGTLFFWPLMGIDPVPGRVSHPFRVLLTLMTLPFHAFLGVTIMGQTTLIGGEHYLALREGPMGAWLPAGARRPAPGRRDPLGDRRPDRRALLRGALHPVGALVDEGGGARGPAPRPGRAPVVTLGGRGASERASKPSSRPGYDASRV